MSMYNKYTIVDNIRTLITELTNVLLVSDDENKQFIKYLDNISMKLQYVNEHILINQYGTYDINVLYDCKWLFEKYEKYVPDIMIQRFHQCINIIKLINDYHSKIAWFKYLCNIIKIEIEKQPINEIKIYQNNFIKQINGILETINLLQKICIPTQIELNMLQVRYKLLANIICSDYAMNYYHYYKYELDELMQIYDDTKI